MHSLAGVDSMSVTIVSRMPKNFTGCALIGKKESIYMPTRTKKLEYRKLSDGVYKFNGVGDTTFTTLLLHIDEFLDRDYVRAINDGPYSAIVEFYISGVKQLSIETLLKDNNRAFITGMAYLNTGLILSLLKLVNEHDFRIEYIMEYAVDQTDWELAEWSRTFSGSASARFMVDQNDTFRFCISFDTDGQLKEHESYRTYLFVAIMAKYKAMSAWFDGYLYTGYGISKDGRIYVFRESDDGLKFITLTGSDYPSKKKHSEIIGLSIADVVSNGLIVFK